MKALIWNTQTKKTLKCSNVSVPEETDIWSLVRYRQAAGKEHTQHIHAHVLYTHCTCAIHYIVSIMSGN